MALPEGHQTRTLWQFYRCYYHDTLLNIRNLATEREVSHQIYHFPNGSLSHHQVINGLSPALLPPSAKGDHYGCFAASRLRRCRLHDRRRARRRRRADRTMMGKAIELRSSRAPLNPKVEVSDVDGWAWSLVSCYRNSRYGRLRAGFQTFPPAPNGEVRPISDTQGLRLEWLFLPHCSH